MSQMLICSLNLLPPVRLPAMGSMIYVPCLDNADKTAFNCIETGYVSSAGNEISKFEEDLKNTGGDYAIAVNSGTSALHLSLIAAGVNSSHEVLVPSLTFVATGNAVLYTGASTHFVDSHEEGFGVDPLKLREHLFKNTTRNQNRETVNPKTGKKIKVLIVTHVFGHIGFINELKQVCDEFDIALVEDAAEALGSSQAETHAGLFGLCGAISFNGNKIITTGAGGCVLTNNAEVAHHIRHLSSTAKIAHRYEFVHDQLGYNYRMPNLNASLGISQLGRLPTFLRAKALLLNAYKNSFSNINGVRV